MPDESNAQITIGSKKATKEEWQKAFVEEFAVWAKWSIKLTIWFFIGLSVWVFYFDHDKVLASIYTVIALCIGINEKLYSLETKIMKQKTGA